MTGYGVDSLIKNISKKLKKKPLSGAIFSRERHLINLKSSLLLLKGINIKDIDIYYYLKSSLTSQLSIVDKTRQVKQKPRTEAIKLNTLKLFNSHEPRIFKMAITNAKRLQVSRS